MTIIVTGGAGFIGSNFIFHMMQAHPDYRLVCLDKLTYAGNLSTLSSIMDMSNFRFVKLDICDRAGVYRLFEEEHPDMVVNCAAESHVDRSIENPEVFLQTNILGTQVLMDACRSNTCTPRWSCATCRSSTRRRVFCATPWRDCLRAVPCGRSAGMSCCRSSRAAD